MRKIVFVGDWVLEQPVGIQRYAYQILLSLDKYLFQINSEFEVELLIPQNSNWKYEFHCIKIVRKGKVNSKMGKHIWEQLTFPIYVLKKNAIGVDLAGALPLFGCKVCAIHDCIHEAYPENFLDHPKHQKIYLAKARWITSKKKVCIITLTEDSKREIQKYYSVQENRISIVSCGWEHMIGIKADNMIFEKLSMLQTKEYFFSLGSKYKHKNYQWILEVAKKNPQLLFVISGTNMYSEHGNEIEKNNVDNMIFTGYLSDGEIKALMEHCQALIQPSLYEGFGLPPLEALSLGTKIIVSNKSCLPEIYGETAYYVDPINTNYDINKLMNRPVDRPETVLEKYSWDKAARSLWNVICSV